MLIRGTVGALIIALLVCIGFFCAGAATRLWADGRVTQLEDSDYANYDCANIKTPKGFRINSEECNKARARKDLDRARLFLYDSNDVFMAFASAARAFLARYIFIVLILLVTFFGAVYYNFSVLYSTACSIVGKRKPFNLMDFASDPSTYKMVRMPDELPMSTDKTKNS
jgi:ABC-type multidrug transport system fused ATPase/permease subunit